MTEELLRQIIREEIGNHVCQFSEEDRVKIRWLVQFLNKTASVIGYAILGVVGGAILWAIRHLPDK